jgi:peroxiredoxin
LACGLRALSALATSVSAKEASVPLRALIFALILALSPAAARAALKVGDAAPDFSIEAAEGGKDFTFTLAEALKKGPVVLYFYPKSFTSVCTMEAHEFAEAMEDFAAANASVIGVSADTIETQREFSKKECRDKFPVGADPDFHVIKAYDAAFSLYQPALRRTHTGDSRIG